MKTTSAQDKYSVVDSLESLQKRMVYFCDSFTPTQKPLMRFINLLFPHGRPYIFGGVIRDIAIHGLNNFKSDIDIVYTGIIQERELKELSIKNKFGGYRITFNRWIIDIWPLEETWSFKTGAIVYESPTSLLKTTQTNYEAIMYDIKDKKLICGDNYISDIKNGYLKVVNSTSPSNLKLLKKILVSIYRNNVKYCDQSLSTLVSEVIKEYSQSDIVNELLQGGAPYSFSKKIIERAIEFENDLFPFPIYDQKPAQYDLPFS